MVTRCLVGFIRNNKMTSPEKALHLWLHPILVKYLIINIITVKYLKLC